MAVGCGLVIPILVSVLTGDVHQSVYVSGRYSHSVRDGYRILFHLGRAHTNLTERWQVLFSGTFNYVVAGNLALLID